MSQKTQISHRPTQLMMGPIFIVIAAILWAFDGVIRRSLFVFSPLHIVFFEHLVGSLFLFPLLRFVSWSHVKKIKWDLGIVSLLSGLLGTVLFTTALQQVFFIPFSVVFLLQKLQPLFAVGSAKVLLKEKFPREYWGWALLALIAAYFVTFPAGIVSISEQGNNIRAALYALGAAFAWGVSTTFSKRVLLEVPSHQATALRFVTTTLMAAFVIVATQSGNFIWPSVPQWLTFGFIALSTGMVALLLYYRGLKETPVGIATLLELVFPLLAVAIDAVIYKSYLVPVQYIAAGVLLFTLSRVGRLQQNQEIAKA